NGCPCSGHSISGEIWRRLSSGDAPELQCIPGSVAVVLVGSNDKLLSMIRPIVLWGSEVLEKPSEPVKNITDTEIKLVQDMIETMYKAPGVGLAAPQVGVSKRIMVTDATGGEKKDHLFTILNPEIVVAEGEQLEEEGCLSIPGFSATVVRPKKI